MYILRHSIISIYSYLPRKKNWPPIYMVVFVEDDGKGQVKVTLVRKFGNFSGKKEIESIAVDDALGYVYYSDEGFGVRKYYADPAKGNEEAGRIWKN